MDDLSIDYFVSDDIRELAMRKIEESMICLIIPNSCTDSVVE
jgi:hypothetical protein